MVLQDHFFFLEQRWHSVIGPGVRAQQGSQIGPRSPLPWGQNNKEGGWFPPAHPTPTPCCFSDSSMWRQRKTLRFHGLEPNGPPYFSVGLVPWDLGAQITGWKPLTQETIPHTYLKSQSCVKRAKQLVIQCHLLENNWMTLYWYAKEVPSTRTCLGIKGIHQIPWIAKVVRQVRKKMKKKPSRKQT